MPRTCGDRGGGVAVPDAEQRGDLGGGPDERRVCQRAADPGRRGVAEKRVGATGLGEHLSEERPALQGVQRAGVRRRGPVGVGRVAVVLDVDQVGDGGEHALPGGVGEPGAGLGVPLPDHLVGGGFPAQFGDQLPAFLAQFAQPPLHGGHLRQRGLAGGVEVGPDLGPGPDGEQRLEPPGAELAGRCSCTMASAVIATICWTSSACSAGVDPEPDADGPGQLRRTGPAGRPGSR